jgi:Tol biopolymer transport system component
MLQYLFIAISGFISWIVLYTRPSAYQYAASAHDVSSDSLQYPKEKHLANMQQLTFGGDNAEAYWSFDSKKLTFQATRAAWNTSCDQIFMIDVTKSFVTSKAPQLISTGKGRTTCSYFMPGNKTILYASTHEADAACPPAPERMVDGKYVWPIFPSFDIYVANLKGEIIRKLTDSPGYDAEATVSPKGDKIVFTSIRSGDLELYTMDIDGKNVHQVTNELGYDGGAFFSPDGSKLVFRASRPKTPEEVELYKSLLAKNLVQPVAMELFICNVDGSGLRQLTHLGKANWAPFFTPKGDKIIFSSNHAAPKGYQFNLYMIGLDGTGLEQITYDPVFDSFPMFSPDGKKIAFSSNRNNGGTHDTNLFIADWVN